MSAEDHRIQVLSDSLINKIAAGEVLERPASAVKELVENSIDAQASRIRVELKGGGRTLMRVVDDGVGMSRPDAMLALKRHATSKIRGDEDLFAIHTLGFRGEALPSIAEVSRFELTTGRRGDEAGTQVLVDGGVVKRFEDAPNPGGTDIRVQRLFFNTPVRLKFLKTPRTEMTHVTQAVSRLAMAHPHVAFELVSDGRKVLDAPRSDDLAGRVATLLGKAVAAAMHPIEAQSAGLRVEGMISDPSMHRSSNAGVHLYVNGRYVRDRTLIAAVLAAFKSHLPRGRYPVAVLFVDVPADRVDVNVHPAKTEVRFRDGRRLYQFLNSRVEERLREIARGVGRASATLDSIVGAVLPRAVQATMPLPQTEAPTFWGNQRAKLMDRARPRPTTAPRSAVPVRQTTRPSSPVPMPRSPHGPEPSVRPEASGNAPRMDGSVHPVFSRLVVLSQFADTFLLCQEGTALLILDQRAARERILFETLSGRAGDAPVGQRLLVPELVEIDREQADVLTAFEPLLADLGVELSSFGEGTLSVHALPSEVDPRRSHPILCELAAVLRGRSVGWTGERLREDLATVLAHHCLSSAGDRLFPEEIMDLFTRLDRVDMTHEWRGSRPIVVRFTRREVDGWFGRK